jgi:hypothetical protein
MGWVSQLQKRALGRNRLALDEANSGAGGRIRLASKCDGGSEFAQALLDLAGDLRAEPC